MVDKVENAEAFGLQSFGVNDFRVAQDMIQNWKNTDPENIQTFKDRLAAATQEQIVGSNVLHIAAENGALGLCRLIVDRGFDVDARGIDTLGRPLQTALWRATNKGEDDTANFLVDKGADIHNKDGVRSPAEQAVMKGMASTVEHMLVSGLDAKEHNELLHYASTAEVAGLLIEAGASVNARDGRGDTPLHVAVYNAWHQEAEAHDMGDEVAERGPSDLVHLLIERGADLNVRNNRGETPGERARNNGQYKTAEFLEATKQTQSLAASIPKPREPMNRPAEDLSTFRPGPAPTRSTRRRL